MYDRRTLVGAATAAGRLFGLLAVTLALASPAAASPQTPLSTEGRWFVDAGGRAAILHGENLGMDNPAEIALITAEHAALLASKGDNSARLGLLWSSVEPAPGVYDDAYLDLVEEKVRLLHAHGIVSVLEFHQDQYSQRFTGRGAPDWATFPTNLPIVPQGNPVGYLTSPGMHVQFTRFLDNASGPGGVGVQDRFAAAWRHVAKRFRGVPGTGAYELFNEPWPGLAWPECLRPQGCAGQEAKIHAFQVRVQAQIRTVDPTTPVWFEPSLLFALGSKTRMPPLPPGHTAFAFHSYCLPEYLDIPGSYSWLTGPLCKTSDRAVFSNAEAYAKRSNSPYVITEFGSAFNPNLIHRTTEAADRHMVGWLHWHDDYLIDPGMLKALTRPYPSAVAGTPTGWSFDRRNRVFSAGWRTTLPSGAAAGARETEIVLPARTYPNGYTVDVSGGVVRSTAGDSVLRVVATPGADDIRVRVTPAPPR
jgi:endoglycosylceramidase